MKQRLIAYSYETAPIASRYETVLITPLTKIRNSASCATNHLCEIGSAYSHIDCATNIASKPSKEIRLDLAEKECTTT